MECVVCIANHSVSVLLSEIIGTLRYQVVKSAPRQVNKGMDEESVSLLLIEGSAAAVMRYGLYGRLCIRGVKDITNEIDWNRAMMCDVSHLLVAVEI